MQPLLRGIPTVRGLRVHEARVHQVRHVAHSIAINGVCPFCSNDYHSRPRLKLHLKYGTKSCRESAAAGDGPIIPSDLVDEAAKQEAASWRKFRQLGIRDDASIPFCTPCVSAPAVLEPLGGQADNQQMDRRDPSSMSCTPPLCSAVSLGGSFDSSRPENGPRQSTSSICTGLAS